MSEENTPVEEPKTPVEAGVTAQVPQEVQEETITLSKSAHEEQLKKAYQRGANLLYSELIGYLFKTCEVFAAHFTPEGGNFENFLGFTLHTMGEEFNKKYIEPKKVKDESKQEDDGKSCAVQGENEASQVASQERHEDVQGGACGGQEACEEPKQEEEKVEA